MCAQSIEVSLCLALRWAARALLASGAAVLIYALLVLDDSHGVLLCVLSTLVAVLASLNGRVMAFLGALDRRVDTPVHLAAGAIMACLGSVSSVSALDGRDGLWGPSAASARLPPAF